MTIPIGDDILEETFLVLMLKDKNTGFFEKELCAYNIQENEEFIVNMYAEEYNNNTMVHIKLTTNKEVEDWEFDAIYDYYDVDIFKEIGNCQEVEDCFNPTWEIVVPFLEKEEMEQTITDILAIHKKEIFEVYETIKNLKNEYI